jgi:hypothetical protein
MPQWLLRTARHSLLGPLSVMQHRQETIPSVSL